MRWHAYAANLKAEMVMYMGMLHSIELILSAKKPSKHQVEFFVWFYLEPCFTPISVAILTRGMAELIKHAK